MAEQSCITDEAKALIGKVAKTFSGTATLEHIRRFAQAIGEVNPIYREEEYARSQGDSKVIAPPLFDETAIDRQGVETQYEVLPSGSRAEQLGQEVPLPKEFVESIDGGNEYTFYRRVYAGDVITATSKLVDLYEKVGRKGGMMIFMVYETTLTNQEDETVLTRRQTIIRRKKALEGQQGE